jgi:hypothetical protein
MAVDTKLLDAQATVCYRLSRLFRSYDILLSKYLEDLGRSFQANDPVAQLKIERLIELHLRTKIDD